MTDHIDEADPIGTAEPGSTAEPRSTAEPSGTAEPGSTELLGARVGPASMAWWVAQRAMWSASTRRVLVVVLVCGLAFDLLVRQGAATVSGTTTLLAFVVGVAWAAPITRASARVSLAGAAIFAVWPSFRTSDWLVPLDVLAVVLLVLLAVALERAAARTVPGFVAIGWAWVTALGTACTAPVHVATLAAANVPEHTELARRRATTIGRGLLFAGPVVVVITALLASADGVFRSFLRVPVSGSDAAEHLGLVLVGTCIAIVPLVRMRAVERPSPHVSRRVALPEVAMVLGALVGVYALFAISQATALVRGDAYIQRTTGLTYAEYARRGYFQLLAVASISALVLLAVRANAPEQRGTVDRLVRLLAAGASLLTILIVASALRRLALYESALGSTMLRLACSVFAVWMAVVFLVLAAGFVRGRNASRDRLPVVVLVSAFATLFVWNAMNPEAYVARHNIDRGAKGASLDVAYLAELSDDAVPTIGSEIGRLTLAQRDELQRLVCGRAAVEDRSLLTTNLAHGRAQDTLAELCGR